MPATSTIRTPSAPTDASPVIVARGLTKVFKDFWLRDRARAVEGLNLEINPRSAVMKRLFETHTAAPEKAKLVAEQILDNALISAGMLEDASPMVARLYKLLENV